MADNLLILLKKHAHVLEENPAFNYDNRWKVDKLYDFDDVFTAPMFGFDSARDYYRHGSPVNRIMGIKVPTVIINALDDPIAHKACIPYIDASKNPYLLLTTTSLGGHLGWYQPHGKLWYPQLSPRFSELLIRMSIWKRVFLTLPLKDPCDYLTLIDWFFLSTQSLLKTHRLNFGTL